MRNSKLARSIKNGTAKKVNVVSLVLGGYAFNKDKNSIQKLLIMSYLSLNQICQRFQIYEPKQNVQGRIKQNQ